VGEGYSTKKTFYLIEIMLSSKKGHCFILFVEYFT